jgi:hypothetical protein
MLYIAIIMNFFKDTFIKDDTLYARKSRRDNAMTVYEELIDLKYRQGVPTVKLLRRFPKHQRRVHEIALLGVPEKTLRKVIREKKLLKRLLQIKKRLFVKTRQTKTAEPKKPWFIWW